MDRLAADLADVQRQHDELASLRVQLRQSEQALARLAELERDAAIAAEERKQLDLARTRLEVLEAELARATAEQERAERGLDEMKRRLSWRITAPLRALRGSR
jgi:multidrug efflux pump subunit AcrA (membrane-fusion protein)